ncbi:MAG: Uncharacterised protein [Synechococcus sp. CC9902]|nr:MAG: Uncharacterised protein [Synechococcus sp. CC9902]
MIQSRDRFVLGDRLFTQAQLIGLAAALHHELEQLIAKVGLILSLRTIQNHRQDPLRQSLHLSDGEDVSVVDRDPPFHHPRLDEQGTHHNRQQGDGRRGEGQETLRGLRPWPGTGGLICAHGMIHQMPKSVIPT